MYLTYRFINENYKVEVSYNHNITTVTVLLIKLGVMCMHLGRCINSGIS
jgi:hypothetical protein